MRRIPIIAGGLLVILFWGAFSIGDEYNRGESIYNNNCAVCHGTNGDGDGPAAPSFSHRPKDFTKPDFWTKNADRLIKMTIEKGRGDMPPMDLSTDEIKAVIDYMSHTFKKG
jgi:mono/diheme cytochrome c family protein